MTSLEKKNKRKGIIGTILFHALLLALFYYIGLSYQDPPPKEEGINIDFGMRNTGIDKMEPANSEEALKSTYKGVTEQSQSTKETLTQEAIETPAIIKGKKTEEEEEEEVEEVVVEEVLEVEEITPKINTKAIYSGKKKNQKTSKSKKYYIDKHGSEEDGFDEFSNDMGSGNNGNSYQLGGRKVINKPKPKGNQIEGRVVVIITVDRFGNVIYANPGAQGSTTLNKELLKRAKIAALNTKFDTKKNAPKNQNGKIIYDFSLN